MIPIVAALTLELVIPLASIAIAVATFVAGRQDANRNRDDVAYAREVAESAARENAQREWVASLERRVDRLQDEVDRVTGELESARSELNECESDRRDLRARIESLEARHD